MVRRRSIKGNNAVEERAASFDSFSLSAALFLIVALMFAAVVISPADAQQSGCDTQYAPGVEPCTEPQPEPTPTDDLQALLLDDPLISETLPAGTEATLVDAFNEVDAAFATIDEVFAEFDFVN